MAFTETLDSVHIYWLGHKAFLDLPHPSICFLSCCFSLFLYSRDLILYPQIRHTFFPPLNFLHAVPSTWNFSLSYLLWDLQNSVKVHLISLIFPWIIINKNKWLPILYCHINRINIYLCTHCTILHFFLICMSLFYLIASCEYRERKTEFSIYWLVIDTKQVIHINEEFYSLSKQSGMHGMV